MRILAGECNLRSQINVFIFRSIAGAAYSGCTGEDSILVWSSRDTVFRQDPCQRHCHQRSCYYGSYWCGRQEMQFFDKIHVKSIVIKAVTMVSTGLVIRTQFSDKVHVKALSSMKLLLWLELA